MSYIERIEEVIKNVNKDILNLDIKRSRRSAPTQVSSEFLTNKEQGDWAEQSLLKGINCFSEQYIAVKYGRDDDIIAGEEGFAEFYEQYQEELDNIGKRPDILIFDKKDFPYETTNISHFDMNVLNELVPKAKCGIEVRSSSFLINKYNKYMEEFIDYHVKNIFNIKENVLLEYEDLLKKKDYELYKIISQIDEKNIFVLSFRTPTWRSTIALSKLSSLLKTLKNSLMELQKRKFLSITPKVEDLKVVYNWVKKYNVPHYYIQVFFDKAYGISYEQILKMLCDEDLEGKDYFIESDVKNQNKTTIKIKTSKGFNVLEKVFIPNHKSQMKELGRGRLLFYVTFEDSAVTINQKEFEELFGFTLK